MKAKQNKDEKQPEKEEEWKPSGRMLKDKELEEYLKSFSDIEESIKNIYKTGAKKNGK